MRTLSPNLNLGFLNSRAGLLAELTKVGILYILWYQIYRAISSRIYCYNKVSQFVNVLVSIVFHVTV